MTCAHPGQDVQLQHAAFAGGNHEASEDAGHTSTICSVVTHSRLEATKYFLILMVAGLAPD